MGDRASFTTPAAPCSSTLWQSFNSDSQVSQFLQNVYASRISPYLTFLGWSQCACLPQNLDVSWSHYFVAGILDQHLSPHPICSLNIHVLLIVLKIFLIKLSNNLKTKGKSNLKVAIGSFVVYCGNIGKTSVRFREKKCNKRDTLFFYI